MKKTFFILIISAILAMAMPAVNANDLAEGVNCALLMEASTGEILFEKNPDEKVSIASVTKIMTSLLIMERIESGALSYDELVTVSDNAMSYGGSTMFLETGEELSVHEMLKGIIVASANDGCVAMAEHIAGTEEKFVEMMNERAAQLGMCNTVFKNSNGLDEEGHYSSARDVAIMSAELLKHPKITEYTTIWQDTSRDGKFDLINTNRLIKYYSGATGLKTGSTSKAGCCLSASAERDGMTLIAVVLGAADTKTRFYSASKLLDYGFSGFTLKKYVEQGEPMGKARILKGKDSYVDIEAAESFSELKEKNNTSEPEKEVRINKLIWAPIKKGDKLGEIRYTINNETVKSVDIIASSDIDKISLVKMFTNLIKGWITALDLQ